LEGAVHRTIGDSPVSENSLLERVTAAAEERHLSQNTLIAYRRTWLKLIAWSAAEALALESLPAERAGEFDEEATRGRSASHHLQVKAALALLYDARVLQIRSPSAWLPGSRLRKSNCVTTPLRNLLKKSASDSREYPL
jgi:hypothetical protein